MNMNRSDCNFLVSKDLTTKMITSFTTAHQNRQYNSNLIWGSINAVLLVVLLVDIMHTCPMYTNIYVLFGEYLVLLFVSINTGLYMCKILGYSMQENPIETSDNSATVVEATPQHSTPKKLSTSSLLDHSSFNSQSLQSNNNWPSASTPNTSWQNASLNNTSTNVCYSPSKSWTNLDLFSTSNVNCSGSFRNVSSFDFIANESDLEKYLKQCKTSPIGSQSQNESLFDAQQSLKRSPSLLDTFWTHPNAKSVKDTSLMLRNHRYQMSPQSNQLKSSKLDSSVDFGETSTPQIWQQLNVDLETLTVWHSNLRKWVSKTILERLVIEIQQINETLKKHGFSDIKLGGIGLDRLKKTAKLPHIVNLVPTLPTMLPFLEYSPNQEYFKRRICDLARGGGISQFKWNSGGSYTGKKWDTSLPNDSEILMHLIVTYLDTQLAVNPNSPDLKPFSGHHFLSVNEKLPQNQIEDSVFIQQVNENPPHYRLFIGDCTYDCPKGYNNLFYTWLLFLYMVNKKHNGMLGQTYLGRTGVNMLWIIDQ